MRLNLIRRALSVLCAVMCMVIIILDLSNTWWALSVVPPFIGWAAAELAYERRLHAEAATARRRAQFYRAHPVYRRTA